MRWRRSTTIAANLNPKCNGFPPKRWGRNFAAPADVVTSTVGVRDRMESTTPIRSRIPLRSNSRSASPSLLGSDHNRGRLGLHQRGDLKTGQELRIAWCDPARCVEHTYGPLGCRKPRPLPSEL